MMIAQPIITATLSPMRFYSLWTGSLVGWLLESKWVAFVETGLVESVVFDNAFSP
jgi:hypothetical protein